MNFMIRPSKCFLFDVLERQLSRVRGGVGLDIGSSDFKNRKMFCTEKYFGFDIDEKRVRDGLTRYPDGNTCGIVADASRIDILPEGSIEAVVSTNTLYALSEGKRVQAVQYACYITSPQGILIIDVPVDSAFQEIVRTVEAGFAKIELYYYRNIISRTYEKIFERNGDLGSHPIAGKRPFRLFSWILSRMEFLTTRIPSKKKYALIIAAGKKNKTKNSFSLSGCEEISPRLYRVKL